MSESLRELRHVVSAMEITAPESFALFGQQYQVEVPDAHVASDSALTDYARRELAVALYDTIHCRRVGHGDARDADLDDATGMAAFVARLSQQNAGKGRREHGWVVREVFDSGALSAEYLGVVFHVERAAYARTPAPPRAGQSVSVRMPKEQRNLLPGFYLALSDADERDDGTPTIKVYWHIDVSGAGALMRGLTRRLNKASLPFRLKVLSDPLAYPRADAAVLYIAARDYREVTPTLRRVYSEVDRFLYPSVSAFAKRLAPGLALAEEAHDDLSFGEHRADQLARALSALNIASLAPGLRFDAVTSHLRMAGVDPAQMFLNAGSSDTYEWSSNGR